MKGKKRSIAIKYLKEDLNVPVVVAKGEGEIAKKIIEEAIKNGIKVVENREIFEYYDLFIVDKEIPEDVYEIVAKILAYVIKTNCD